MIAKCQEKNYKVVTIDDFTSKKQAKIRLFLCNINKNYYTSLCNFYLCLKRNATTHSTFWTSSTNTTRSCILENLRSNLFNKCKHIIGNQNGYIADFGSGTVENGLDFVPALSGNAVEDAGDHRGIADEYTGRTK